jgi:hypothetical protein
LRPGEKLHEELVGPGETVQTSGADKILKIRPALHVESAALMDRIVEMEKIAIAGRSKDLLRVLCEIVPNFQPIELNERLSEKSRENERNFKVVGGSNVPLPAASTPAKKSKSLL